MIRIIKTKRLRELEQAERILNSRIKESELMQYADLVELSKILREEFKDVDRRMKLLLKTYGTLKRNKYDKS